MGYLRTTADELVTNLKTGMSMAFAYDIIMIIPTATPDVRQKMFVAT